MAKTPATTAAKPAVDPEKQYDLTLTGVLWITPSLAVRPGENLKVSGAHLLEIQSDPAKAGLIATVTEV